MQHPIEIRQTDTGEAKQFHDTQAIADFLAGRDDADKWEGYQCLGTLPAPTGTAAVMSDEPEEVEAETQTPMAPKTAAKPKAKAKR